MRLTRDSALWWLLLVAGAATFLTGHFDVLTKAFGISETWQARIELIGGFATFVAGYLRLSPLPLSRDSELRGQGADPNQSLSMTGSKLPEKAAMVLMAIVVSSSMACAPKQYRLAVVANNAYAQAIFAVQDAEIASHDAKLIPDDKHQDYKRIIAKLLRAGDAVTIALQHWQPGVPMPQVVAGAFKDAADLFADVSALFPASDPFVGKIREVLGILQKFGVIPSDLPDSDWDRVARHRRNESVDLQQFVAEFVLQRGFDPTVEFVAPQFGAATEQLYLHLNMVGVAHGRILHPEVTRG